MAFVDELMGALSSARGMLGALGPRPKGDVAGMRALAAAARAEADLASSAASAAGALPGSLVFSGPAATQLKGNASLVQGVAASAAQQLNAAADQVTAEASKIERKQHAWDRDHKRLEGQFAGLAAQIRSAR